MKILEKMLPIQNGESHTLELPDDGLPMFIDLESVFGARGLRFRAAAEDGHVVHLSVHGKYLSLTAAEERFCDQSRVAVRAFDEDGCSVLTMLEVSVCRPESRLVNCA